MGITRDADFSECGTWRYTLRRTWDPAAPSMVMVLLNPSTADASKDDPTNRRGMGFARREGCGSLIFVNLFAFRTPSPAVMRGASDPVGPENDAWIERVVRAADVVVLGWGVHGTYRRRDQAVLRLLEPIGQQLWCLGRTKAGMPRHPLFLRADTPLELFS